MFRAAKVWASNHRQKPKPYQKGKLPIELEEVQNSDKKLPKDILLFEPSPDRILEKILPHFVLTRIYQALLEAKASEHSARMVAMKNATDAANDLVEDLTLTYNQARQEAITKELLDIVTAQAAFEWDRKLLDCLIAKLLYEWTKTM